MDPSYNPRQPSLSWKIHELLKCDENALEFFGNVRAKKIFTGIDFLDRLGLGNEDSGDSGPTNDFHGGSGGLLSGQFISISGDHGSGKSELLVHAAVKSALSDDFGGQRQSVVYFSLDSKFDIERISSVAKYKIIRSNSSLARQARSSPALLQSHIRDTLSRIHIVPCYNPHSLFMALMRLSMDRLLLEDVSLVIMDSFGSYFYSNKLFETGNASAIVNGIVEALKSLLHRGSLLVLAGQQNIFQSSNASDYMARILKHFNTIKVSLKSRRSRKGEATFHNSAFIQPHGTKGSFSVNGHGTEFPQCLETSR